MMCRRFVILAYWRFVILSYLVTEGCPFEPVNLFGAFP